LQNNLQEAAILPANVEAERYVLGTLLKTDIIDTPEAEATASLIFEKLSEDDFSSPRHRIIFSALKKLYEKGYPLEFIALAEELTTQGKLEEAGGAAYISELAAMTPPVGNPEYYVNLLKNKALLRRLYRLSEQIKTKVLTETAEAEEVMDWLEQKLLNISSHRRTTVVDFSSLADSALTKLDQIYTNNIEHVGVPSGFVDLDRKTGGFQPGSLVVLAARPSMGKTALALNIASNVAIRQKKPVLIFSLEMPAEQLFFRILCAEAKVNLQLLLRGELYEEELERFITLAHLDKGAPIYIADEPTINVYELKAKAKRLKIEKGIEMIIVDYLQLLSAGRRDSKQQEVAEVSRTLKLLAIELEVPVIALSQLNRAPEQRQDKRPTLADLRESGAIEQDADLVIFIYRDEYYNPDTELKNVAELIIGKNRNGPVGTVQLAFFKEYTRFENLALQEE